MCHASGDRDTATRVVEGLEANGVSCWIAPRDVPPGENYAQAILTAIGECRLLVLVFSSQANRSPHVAREVERAVSRGLAILPLRVEAVHPEGPLEYFVSSAQWVEATDQPLKAGLDELAAAVLERLGMEAPATTANEPEGGPDGGPEGGPEGGFAAAPRDTLRELVARYGTELAEDPRRVRSLLRDIIGEYRLEISALVVAAEEGVGPRLMSSSESLGSATAGRLAAQLQSERALSAEAATWAVEAWAEALDLRLSVPPRPATDQVDVQPDVAAVARTRAATPAPEPVSSSAPVSQREGAPPGGSRWGWIAAAALAVVLVGIIAFALGGGDDTPSAQQTTTTRATTTTELPPTTGDPTITTAPPLATTSTAGPTTTAEPTTTGAPSTTETPTTTIQTGGEPAEPACPGGLGVKTLDFDSRNASTVDDITTESLICIYRVGGEEDWWSLSVYWVEPGENGRFLCSSSDFENPPEDVPWGGMRFSGDTAVRVHYGSTTVTDDEQKVVLRSAATEWLPDVIEAGTQC